MSPGIGGYTSITVAVKKMAREEGIRGFYKGLYPNLLKVNTQCPNVPLISCIISSALHTFLLL
jgi:hypothetical protein